ncbi:glycosyltransferase involved in cell wall biosynthesis [Flavobacterium sp. 7E]|uniref:glycosyltransferase family 2 protein n=1 Tax=Flavobacterium sp. 7E TaxID=2735898 RepID=UPI00156EFE24|nr:glycosyltransferase family 2 protein [Flavobacterium sp. 7E]NRS89396.1 glycosyltransferase involved in cell wall biosynthesis [Flavobacterium sp. 7E]
MLAIIIPYYKIRFFEATLQSLALQTDKRFKVYIGNDASKDDPTVLLEKYQNQFDFDYHFYDVNLGSVSLTQQWERCLTQVQGEEWVMLLGDDDVLDTNCVASFYENLDKIIKSEINVVRYATVVIDQNDLPLSGIYKHPELEKTTDFLMRKFKGGTRSSLSEFIFKTSVLKDVQFNNFPLAWFSDILAVLEVSNFGLIYTINEAVVSFRLSGDNITSRNDNLVLKNVGSFEFYHYLIKEKSPFFNENEIMTLKNQLEKTFLDNKKSLHFWRLFTILYFSNLFIKSYFMFICKAMKMVVK